MATTSCKPWAVAPSTSHFLRLGCFRQEPPNWKSGFEVVVALVNVFCVRGDRGRLLLMRGANAGMPDLKFALEGA
jgi:hypothetical protein